LIRKDRPLFLVFYRFLKSAHICHLTQIVLFAEFTYDEHPANEPNTSWGAKGTTPSNFADLFDTHWPTNNQPQGRVTQFFAEASFNNLRVLAD
jgi:hypothetical protein